jgi:hypothetical protein
MAKYFIRTHFYEILLVVCIFVISAFRIHLLAVPLERDEGEYAYSGQLILQGIPPFSQSYNMKMPGIYLAYAVILACFGQTSAGIHTALLLINLLCSLALYLIGKRLYNSLVGCCAGAAFASMTLSSSVLGLSANAEHFVVVFALFGIFVLLKAIEKESPGLILLSGLLFGIAFLMKQHGAAFVAFGFSFLLWNEFQRRGNRTKNVLIRGTLFCAGAAAPFAVVCLWLWSAGVFHSFWFWTFTYAHAYVSQIPMRTGVLIFRDVISNIIAASPVFWLLALVGLVLIIGGRNNSRNVSFFILMFLIFGFLSTCPGFYFREHYFILLLPAISLLSAIGLNAIRSFLTFLSAVHSFIAPILLLCAFFSTPIIEQSILFEPSPVKVSRLIYGPNPFSESCVIADSIKAWSSSTDKIGILGSEPQIFFYTTRKSASGYIYTYALMEKHPFALRMQREMIRQLETAAPKFLVYVNVEVSWLMRRDSYPDIFKWFNSYQRERYEIAGVADIVSARKTVYAWGKDAVKYSPVSSSWVAIFKRKA